MSVKTDSSILFLLLRQISHAMRLLMRFLFGLLLGAGLSTALRTDPAAVCFPMFLWLGCSVDLGI